MTANGSSTNRYPYEDCNYQYCCIAKEYLSEYGLSIPYWDLLINSKKL